MSINFFNDYLLNRFIIELQLSLLLGILGEVFADDSTEALEDWVIYPLDFRPQYLNKLVHIHMHEEDGDECVIIMYTVE